MFQNTDLSKPLRAVPVPQLPAPSFQFPCRARGTTLSPCRFPLCAYRASLCGLFRSNQPYKTGNTTRVKKVELKIPPITTVTNWRAR